MVKKIIIDGVEVNITESTELPYKHTFQVKGPHSVKYITDDGELPILKDCDKLLSIKIPSTATKIEADTFKGCHKLTLVEIPGNVTNVNLSAFNGCSNLSTVSLTGDTLPTLTNPDEDSTYKFTTKNAVESITGVEWATVELIKSTTVTVYYNVTSADLNSAEIVSTLNGVTSYTITKDGQPYTFTIANRDTKFTEPGQYVIEYHCDSQDVKIFFWQINTITKIVLSNDITSIPGLFINSSKLTELNLGTSLISMGGSCISSPLITSITLPDTLKTCGDYCFSCPALTTINVPLNLEDFGGYSFYNTAITTPVYNQNVFAYMPPTACPDYYEIAPGTKVIAGAAFWNCTNLKKISMTTGILKIGPAFPGCTALEEIIIPDTCQELTGTTFTGCTNLKTVVLGSGIKELEAQCFGYCSSLETLVLKYPGVVKPFNNYGYAFYQMGSDYKLNRLTVPSGYRSQYNNSAYWKTTGSTIYRFLGEILPYEETSTTVTTSNEATTFTTNYGIQVGQILYKASDDTRYVSNYSSSNTDTPIGICVIPSEFMPDGEARFAALNYVVWNETDLKGEEISDWGIVNFNSKRSDDTLYYGNYASHFSLLTYDYTIPITPFYPYIGKIYSGRADLHTTIQGWRQDDCLTAKYGASNSTTAPWDTTTGYTSTMDVDHKYVPYLLSGYESGEKFCYALPSPIMKDSSTATPKFYKDMILNYTIHYRDADQPGNVFYNTDGKNHTQLMDAANATLTKAGASYPFYLAARLANTYSKLSDESDKGSWYLPSPVEASFVVLNANTKIDPVLLQMEEDMLGASPTTLTYESPVTVTPFHSIIKTASAGTNGTNHYMWTANKANPCRTVLYTTQGQIVTVDSCDRGGRTRPFIKGNFEVR